ncbi:hypothetical protein Bbelb_275340 [Branchiostoma belcheri]|nr:hypothetical protein Bbelb_275340 [Branchiostoma belcheri]
MTNASPGIINAIGRPSPNGRCAVTASGFPVRATPGKTQAVTTLVVHSTSRGYIKRRVHFISYRRAGTMGAYFHLIRLASVLFVATIALSCTAFVTSHWTVGLHRHTREQAASNETTKAPKEVAYYTTFHSGYWQECKQIEEFSQGKHVKPNGSLQKVELKKCGRWSGCGKFR